jgi:hypothetical protein
MYIYFFFSSFCVSFQVQLAFFSAKLCTITKLENNLQQAQNVFFLNFTKKVGEKGIIHHL